MNGLRQKLAIEILKLNPQDRDTLADVIGLSVYGIVGIGCLIFCGYGGWRLLHFLGMI